MKNFDSNRFIDSLNQLQNEFEFQTAPSESQYTLTWSSAEQFASVIDKRSMRIASTPDQSKNLEESLMAYFLGAFDDERRRIKAILDPERNEVDLRVVKYSPSYDLVFSLLNGGGIDAIHSWPITDCLKTDLDPLLQQVSTLSDFQVDSQIQYYADLTFQPRFDESSGDFVLSKADLNNFINSAEWNLASAQGDSKPLNFVVYVPKPEHRPLVIRDDDKISATNSFLIPQFGSIVIYNPPGNTTVMQPETLKHILNIQVSHFMTLLGVPSISSSHFAGDTSLWRLDGLIRHRIIETTRSAQLTLHSISKIVDQIPNMHVPQHVATHISTALEYLDSASTHLDRGSLDSALLASRQAVKYAELAFFDHQMVSLLYFPDEHKYGVYMPLFGPLFLPLGIALFKELKLFIRS